MSLKLNQLLAREKGVKTSTNQAITEAYQTLQKPQLLTGQTRVYQSKDDEGESLPSETMRVQVRAYDELRKAEVQFAKLWDVVASKDWANTEARADVIVDGQVIIAQAPPTFLLWLEKQLTDLYTLASKVPTLDPGEEWTWSDEQACYVAAPTITNRSKKVPRVLVKAEATDKHPAQTEVFTEDVVVGQWTTIRYSGALPVQHVRDLTDRIDALRDAVRVARQAANAVEVTEQSVAATALAYVFSSPLRHLEGGTRTPVTGVSTS